MTFDELHKTYDEAYKQYQKEPINGWSAEKAERFALAAVVRALRPEMFKLVHAADVGLIAPFPVSQYVDDFINRFLATSVK